MAIIGLGLSGTAVQRLLLSLGYQSSEIFLFDEKPQEKIPSEAIYTSLHELIEQARPKTLIVSPGVSLAKNEIQAFKQAGGFITSELALACDQLTNEKIIAVTGSYGKSTCVSLLGSAAKKENPNNIVSGNIGSPLADYIVNKKNHGLAAEWIILELSSYQLENFENLNPEFSLITSLGPNHLERYRNIEHYYETKWSLLKKTKFASVLNQHGGDLKKFQSTHPTDARAIWSLEKFPSYFDPQKSRLLGEHNENNLLLCLQIAEIAGWRKESIVEMLSFSGLPHRIELLSERDGVQFINDSKATTIDSVLAAIQATQQRFSSTKKIHLLLGGRDKNLPWQELKNIKNVSRFKFYFFGESAELIKNKSGLTGPVYKKFGGAIAGVRSSTQSGEVVLLSPGGTSLDEFKNFEERGDFFRTQTKELWSS